MNIKNNFYKLIIFGSVAALFFSLTFIFNRDMALENDHWFWSASLRYIYMFVILSILIAAIKGKLFLLNTVKIFFKHYIFWTIVGGIGFGLFYLGICYAASFSAGWIVATTWQLTIVFSPFVLKLLGHKDINKNIILCMVLIFIGILFVNISEFGSFDKIPYFAIFIIIISAIAYPFGNTASEMAVSGNHSLIPHITNKEINFIFSRVLLMTLGSFPLLIVTWLAIKPPSPTTPQLLKVFVVTVIAGVIATSIYLYAREKLAKTGIQKAILDSTQALEVPFALILEVLFLNILFPSLISIIGLLIVIAGIFLSKKEHN